MTYTTRLVTEPSEFRADYYEMWHVVDRHDNRTRLGSVTIETRPESGLEVFEVRWHNGDMWQAAETRFLEDSHELLKSYGYELIDRENLD